jgi:nucleoid-associated protein YgaU
MKVRKPVVKQEPGYPDLRRLAGSARRLGLAALGAGAVGVSQAGDAAKPLPLGGVPPPPRQSTNSLVRGETETSPPVPLGVIRPDPPRLRGKVPVDVKVNRPLSTTAHVVQPGETLSGIAKQKLGDAARWREIATLNPRVDPDHLKVGQRLVLPKTGDRK